MTGSSSPSPEPLLSSLCPYCNAQPPKYRCPACSARTCSLACSKKHKIYSQCTGVRDPAAFVKRSQLANPAKLNQDYNYLMGVEKAIIRGPKLSIDEPELVREGEGEGEGKEEKGRSDPTEPLGDAERKRLARQIEESRGVVVRQAPRGMKRARENATAFTGGRRKRKTVRWTVEWLLYDQSRNDTDTNPNSTPQLKRILSTRVQENSPLAEAFLAKLHHQATSNNPAPQQNTSTKASRRTFTSTCIFYLKAVNVPANKPTLIELAPEKPLSDVLRGQVVLEFPTIVVIAKGAEAVLSEWTIIERPRKEENTPPVNDEKLNEEGLEGEVEGDSEAEEVDRDDDASHIIISPNIENDLPPTTPITNMDKSTFDSIILSKTPDEEEPCSSTHPSISVSVSVPIDPSPSESLLATSTALAS